MPQASTQNSIDVAGIKDGIVVLKNGGYRIILSVSATNFALKSEQEQNSLVFQYQSFLNSLHFPIEILIRSKRLDLSPYLKKINDLIQKQENELLRMQTEDYADFVTKLIDLANIMKKTFYVTVPFDPVTVKKPGFVDKILNREKSVIAEMRISEDEFHNNSNQLRQRAQVVAGGLGSMGLRCTQMTTEEIIELMYQIYNPEIAGKEQFQKAEELAAPVVRSMTEKPQDQKQPIENMTNQEEVIDNSATVESWQKETAMQRKQEMEKNGERQIGMTPATNRSSSEDKPKPDQSATNNAGQSLPLNNQTSSNNNQTNSNAQ